MTIQTLARERPELFRGPVAGVVLINTTYTTPLRTMILPRLMQALRWPLIEPMLFLTRVLWPLAWLSAWQSYLSGSAHMANRFAFAGPPARADLEHVTLMTTKASPAVSAKGNLAMMRWDAGDGPAKIGVPLLAIGGGADIITKAEASQAIAAQAPSAQAIIVPGANHMGFLEKEDDYVRLIRDFAYQAQQAAASKA
jgi:pimeloyl-ACP methyl ester carboxylesterase